MFAFSCYGSGLISARSFRDKMCGDFLEHSAIYLRQKVFIIIVMVIVEQIWEAEWVVVAVGGGMGYDAGVFVGGIWVCWAG